MNDAFKIHAVRDSEPLWGMTAVTGQRELKYMPPAVQFFQAGKRDLGAKIAALGDRRRML